MAKNTQLKKVTKKWGEKEKMVGNLKNVGETGKALEQVTKFGLMQKLAAQ